MIGQLVAYMSISFLGTLGYKTLNDMLHPHAILILVSLGIEKVFA